MNYKVGLPLVFQYRVKNKTLGLTDLTLKTYNPSGVLVDTIIMTEVAEGRYSATFTPTVTGLYAVTIKSVTNGDDFVKGYEIESYNLGDIQTNIDEAEVAIAALDSKVVTVDGKVVAVGNQVTGVSEQVTTVDNKVVTVDGKVDAVGNIATAIKSKTDNLPANTASELASIKATVENIDLETDEGGYII